MSLTPDDFMTAQAYASRRHDLKPQFIAHRRLRSLAFGPAMRLLFEDELTVRYQIQEVLRVENVVDVEGMRDAIATYAHLVPDAAQWKATLQIELPDAGQRRRELPLLNEAVHHIFAQTARVPRLIASANDDLPDRHRGRPSAVHFLRFQLPPAFRAALAAGQSVALGCDHPAYPWKMTVPVGMLARLRRDVAPSSNRYAALDTSPSA